MAGRLKKLKPGPHNERVQVISSPLCDDVVRRLIPSLKPHIGCDIIDINPGVCLWSSKIHEFLKPRRHILVEPLEQTYKPWIAPLLNAPDSRYRLARIDDGDGPWDLQNYVAMGLLPEQAESINATSTTENGKPQMLILANMGRHAQARGVRRKVRKTVDSHYRILEYLRCLRTSSGFHTNGAVRMLMWMLDEEKTNILPRTAFLRRRVSVLNELSCHVEEVVGDVLAPDAARREANIDLQSCKLAAKRMVHNDIKISSTRLDELPHRLRADGLEATGKGSVAIEGTIHGERDWHQELLELEKGFADGTYRQFVGGPPGRVEGKRATSKMRYTPEYRRLTALLATANEQRIKKANVDKVLEQAEEIRQLDLAIAQDLTLDEEARSEKLQHLDDLTAQYKTVLSQQTEPQQKQIEFFADDRAAWNLDRPLLLWDQRAAEPIIARADEFYNPHPLALLDFQPQTPSQSPLSNTQQEYLNAMLLSIFTAPRLPVANALDAIAPGAAAALIPKVPSLRDPTRGGRRDLEQLRVRLLTPEMLRDLAVAWEEWKFRPSLAELARGVAWTGRDVG